MAKLTVAAFSPSRLTLGKCRDELAARNAADALTDMIRDGRRWSEEHDRNGPLLYFGDSGLSRLNNPLYQHEIECIWGWGWLRESPDLDVGTSMIKAPDLNPDPGPELSGIQKTLREVSRLYAPPPLAPRRRWIPTRLTIDTADFYRALGESTPEPAEPPQEAPPQPGQQPAAGDKPLSRHRGPLPKKLNRVVEAMEKKFCSDSSRFSDLKTWSGERLATTFKTSRSTADRARKKLLSKCVQD
jgi:hypothetical protein